MTDINLLPQKSRGRFSQEQVLVYTKILAISGCILTVCLAIVLFFLNRDPTLVQIQAQEQTILAQLNILHSKTAKDLIILDRMKRISKVLQNRGVLDKKIADIQKQIPSNVTVASFSLDNKNLLLTLNSQSLSPLGAFVESLANDVQTKKLVKKVTVEGLVSDEKTGTFLLNITCDIL